MTKIIVLGATGYAGSALVAEAKKRGHEVVGVSRSEPATQVNDVRYIISSLTDDAVRRQAFDGAEVIIGALSPRGDMAGKLKELYATITNQAVQLSARFIVIGGFGSLRSAAGEPRFVEGADFPEEFRPEASELANFLTQDLVQNASDDLDWLYVSPAQQFGAFAPGETTGKYLVGNDVAIFDVNGESYLSNGDLAVAILDEIEAPRHRREHISLITDR